MTTKSTKQGTDKAANAVEDVVAAGQDAMQSFMKVGAENYEKAFGSARAKVEEAVKNFDQFALNGKDNVEAVMAASTACTKGMEAINAEMLGFARQMFDEGMTATKAMLGAKTLQEMVDLQTKFAKQNLDGFMTQSTKVGEMATKVAQDTAEPLNARMTAVMEKWTHLAA